MIAEPLPAGAEAQKPIDRSRRLTRRSEHPNLQALRLCFIAGSGGLGACGGLGRLVWCGGAGCVSGWESFRLVPGGRPRAGRSFVAGAGCPAAAGAPYRAGRTRDWLKFKCEAGQEFVIGGFTDPRGSRTGFGALLLGYYDPARHLIYAGKVGTGFSQQMLERLHATLAGLEQDRPPFDRGELPRSGVHWVQPRLVAEVGFSEWTTAGELRHPRFQGLRDDKDPADVVRETPQDNTR